jgi:hypothetical protein
MKKHRLSAVAACGAMKPAWKSPKGILAGKAKITGDIVNFDTSELWDACRRDDALSQEMIRILSARDATPK